MVIAIDENLLITLISIFFIPTIGVVAKMFMQLRQNQSKIEEISDLKANGSDLVKRISELENEMSGVRVKMDNIDKMAVRIREYVLEQKRKADHQNDNGFIG